MLKSLVVLFLLAYYANAQAFQGGTMSYRIMKTNNDNVIIRFYHKFLQYSPETANAKICTDNCKNGKIPADELRFKRKDGTTADIKRFNGSFYCDIYNKVDNILIGSLETDMELPRQYDVYDISHLSECCAYPVANEIRPTYDVSKFQLSANIKKRDDNNDINNPPDTRFAPIYTEMKFKGVNSKKLEITDSNEDIVRCEWSSSTCKSAASICNSFKLENCTLSLVAAAAPQLYSIGILVKDYPKGTTAFTTPLSTVPFFMIVNVLADADNTNRTAYQCPEKSRPIQNNSNNSNTMQISLPFCLFYSVICLISSILMKY